MMWWSNVMMFAGLSFTSGERFPVPNFAVDDLLAGIEQQVSNVSTKTEVPDVSERWPVGHGFLSTDLLLDCSQGNITHLSGFRRKSDTVAVRTGVGYFLRMTLLIQSIQVTFGKCQFKFGFMGSTGPFQLNGRNIVMDLNLFVKKTGETCTNKVTHMKVTDVRDLTTDMGDGVAKKIESMVAGFLARRSREKMVEEMNNSIQGSLIKSEIEKSNFCQYLLPYLNV